jgi:uncharacterized protein YjbI with pentapeptide repeats
VIRQVPTVPASLAPAPGPIEDETDWQGVLITGDLAGSVATSVELAGCRADGVRLAGADLGRVTFTDCVFVDCDLSGLVLEEARLTRVELVRCRMGGVLAATARFRDVAFRDCLLRDANLRMTQWERSEVDGCDLRETDLYAAKLGGTPLTGCDLRDVELSKADLGGCRLHGSRLEGIKGGASLRGVVLAGDQLVPAALALFIDLGIVLEDD